MNKTVVLTGATGFLGSRILAMLVKKDFNVIVLKRSFSHLGRIDNLKGNFISYNIDEVQLDTIFSLHKIDFIIHTATLYGRGNDSIEDILNSNLKFPLQLLQLGIKNNITAFINTDTALPRNVNSYSLSKKQFTDWLTFFQGKIKSINVIPEYFYGEGDDNWKLIPMIIGSLKANKHEINFTSGEQKRDFIYIDDLVKAYEIILDRMETLESNDFSVGSGELVSIKDLAFLCKKLTGNDATIYNFGALAKRENEYDQETSIHNQIKEIGWNPNYTLEQGITKYINNYY